MPSFINRAFGWGGAAPQQPGRPTDPNQGQSQATLAGPPELARRSSASSNDSRPPRQPSPYANGIMSTPAEGQAAPAPGWRMPKLSAPGAKKYPISLNAQIAGFALVNKASSGPAKPTTADAMPKPSAESLRVAIPATSPERVALAREQAALATQAADAATQPEAAPAVRKKKGLLRSAKRWLSKGGAKVGAKTLGIGMPDAPTVRDVLQVGRPRRDGPPPQPSATQERQIAQQRTVVNGVHTTYHARAGRAALATVKALHAHEEPLSEQLVSDYVDRFAQLHGAFSDAMQVLQDASTRLSEQKLTLADIRKATDNAHKEKDSLLASLPQLETALRDCRTQQQNARHQLRQAIRTAESVPERERNVAQARSAQADLQRWAAELAQRREQIGRQAGLRPVPRQELHLLDHEEKICHGELAAGKEQLDRCEADLAHAQDVAGTLAAPGSKVAIEAELARLSENTRQAAERLENVKHKLRAKDVLIQHLGESQQTVTRYVKAAQAACDAAQKDFDAAQSDLNQHRRAMRGLESAVQPALDIERSLDQARDAQARLDASQHGVKTRLDTFRNDTSKAARQALQSMLEAPPGFAGTAVPAELNEALVALRDRLAAAPPAANKLAVDETFELVLRSAAISSGGDPAQAARSLQALCAATLADLARPVASQTAGNPMPSQAAALAQEVSRLPRGMEILSTLMTPSQPALDQGRVRAVQVYLAAGAELARIEPSDNAARQWLTNAQAGAALFAQGLAENQVPHEQRAAFNGVRNGFMTNGPGSDYEKTDKFMRSISDEMLQRALAARPEPGLRGRIATGAAHLMPIHKPTPFNRAALEAASQTALSVGIVSPPQEALDKLFKAIEPLRAQPGSGAGLPVMAGAVLAFTDALQARAATQPPLSLALDDTLTQAVDARLRAADGGMPQAWAEIKAAQPRPHPLEALHTLLDLARREADPPNPALAGLGRALDLARGSFFMADPRIETTQDIVAYCQAIIPNLKLRDKIKMTGGKVLGVATNGLAVTQAVQPGIGAVGRLDLRKSQQNDQVVDLVMGTQAIQLTIGTQTTKVDRGGVGGGVGFKIPGALTVRPLDLDWKSTREVQSQDGVLLRVPRDKKTERSDLAKFQAMVTDVIKWTELKRPDGKPLSGPLEAVLALHPAASVNLLAEYDRQARKLDATAGAVLSVGLPGARITATPLSAGAKNQVMVTRAAEATGHFQFQERKKNVVAATQVGAGVGLSIPLLSAISGNTGLTANGTRLAETADVRTRGVEITVRLTTEDNVIAPLKSRFITEHLRADDFEKAIRSDWKNWVAHGVAYTTSYPADWSDEMKHTAAERELVDFLAQVKAKQNEFMAFSQVTAMRPEVAPRVDALRGLIETARRSGDAAELAKQEHRLDQLLAEPSTWMVRRLVVNERANRTEQRGLSLLAVAQVSSVADAQHNALLYPRG